MNKRLTGRIFSIILIKNCFDKQSFNNSSISILITYLTGDNMKFAKTIVMTAITSSALIMTGCNSTGGYNGNVSNTAKGAGAGAVAGALIRSKGDSKDIARGALAGAALGGAGGYIIDNR